MTSPHILVKIRTSAQSKAKHTMSINPITKGKQGEYEAIKRLQPFFPNTLERNLLQTRCGGSDITGCHPFVIEVKRVQDTSLSNKNSWWKQVTRAIIDPEVEIPVVYFRPNRGAWRVLLSTASLVPSPVPDNTYWLETDEDTFLRLVANKFDL